MTEFIPGGPARYDHQRRGLRKLIETRGVCALLFDPGLGKTGTTIDYMSLLALKSPSREVRVLVVCPLVAIDTWVIQMEKFASPQVDYWAEALGGSIRQRAETLISRGPNPQPTKPRAKHAPRALNHHLSLAWGVRGLTPQGTQPQPQQGPDAVGDGTRPRIVLEVINTDSLSSRARVGSKNVADIMLNAVKRFQPDLVVVDESHKIKSANGNASRLLGRIAQHVPRRIMLTGTVMPHGPLDVYGQWRFLEPYAFGDRTADGTVKRATFGGFQNRFATFGGWMGNQVVGFKNLDEMQEIMARNSIVARKADSLDLPPTTDVIVPVELSAAEKQAYSDMRDALATQFATGQTATVTNRLTQALRLRQITSGHLPDDNGTVTVIGRSKVDTIKSLVHDTLVGEKRIVIFALFTAEINMLSAALANKDTEVMTITGGTSQAERVRMRQRFGSDDPQRIVMVAQIKTMSVAVNELVTANHAIFGSLSQQRDDYVQARDRLDRIGQTRPVTFWHCNAVGTIDGVILDSHRDRTDLESAVLRHIHDRNN